MDSLIDTFHIDLKILIAQVVNFAIVISVLYFFALKPLTKVMKDRTVKIEKSLEDAKKIDAKLTQTEADYSKEISKAKKEAVDIMKRAQDQSEIRNDQMIKEAKNEIGRLIADEKSVMQEEKAKVLKEIKSDVADLVIATTQKILEKKVDSKEDQELIKKIIK